MNTRLAISTFFYFDGYHRVEGRPSKAAALVRQHRQLLSFAAGMESEEKKGQIGCYDIEHQEYADLCSLADFLMQPEYYIIKFIEGD